MGYLDVNLHVIAARVLALLIISSVHGGTVALVAYLLGDKGPKYDGRLTASPFRHLDLVGGVGLVVFGLGWTKPVDVDARQIRIGPIGLLLVVLAGALALLATAAILDALVRPALTTLPHTAALTTAAFLRTAGNLALWVALFSLVPIPPLTAGILLGALGIRLNRTMHAVLVAALFAAVAFGVARPLLAPAHAIVASAILGR